MTVGWIVPDQAPDQAPAAARCRICDRWGPATTAADGVLTGPVRWRDPLPGQAYDAVPRCRDHDACWRRVTEAGDPWPLDDGRPVGARKVEAAPAIAVLEAVVGSAADHAETIPVAEPEPADDLDWGFGA